jgi:hypothetical protein
MPSYELKGFAAPDEVREFPMGRGDVVNIGGGQVLMMTLQPGWRWSEHLKPVTGTDWCEAPHFQYVISGRLHVVTSDGDAFDVEPGSVNFLQPGHDAWVVGDEPVVAVDWGGAHVWAKPASA